MTDQMKQKGIHLKRRSLLKKVAVSGAVTGVAASMPNEWIKPVVDAVIIPAHAMCSADCSMSFTIDARDIPVACSGTSFPPIVLNGSIAGCGPATIESLSSSLPGSASYTASISKGSKVSPGDTFTITVLAYPSSSPFACTAVEPGNITIDYSCDDTATAPASSATIDVLGEILKG